MFSQLNFFEKLNSFWLAKTVLRIKENRKYWDSQVWLFHSSFTSLQPFKASIFVYLSSHRQHFSSFSKSSVHICLRVCHLQFSVVSHCFEIHIFTEKKCSNIYYEFAILNIQSKCSFTINIFSANFIFLPFLFYIWIGSFY